MIDRSHRNLALLVSGCFFMEIPDGTIVTTAAPKVGHSPAVPSTSISLVITAYLVTLAVLIPLSGYDARASHRSGDLVAETLLVAWRRLSGGRRLRSRLRGRGRHAAAGRR